MFINPKTAIEKGWIKGNISEKQIQPNAIDFTLDRLFHIDTRKEFYISEESKLMRPTVPQQTTSCNGYEDVFLLLDGVIYDGMSDLYVELPEGVAASLIIRSTFNRNGLFITSGLYDSGFKGHIGFTIHNRAGLAYIAPGTRIGQIIFVEASSAGVYAGGWNHTQGSHYTEK